MQRLSSPDQSLVTRILTEVSYEQRLMGYRYRPRWGGIPAHVYRFRDVVRLLSDKYPRINLNELVQWLRTAMGDEELADRVAEAIEVEPSDRQKMVAVRSLMEERLKQCASPAATHSDQVRASH